MRRSFISALIPVIATLFAQAQYNPTVNVDGTYKPDIIDRDRINTFPDLPKLQIPATSLQFDLKGVNADFPPTGIPMEATGWETLPKAGKGFVYAELGSWLNAGLIAAYRFVDTRSTTAWIRFDHNSTSLWKPGEDYINDKDRRREACDERLRLGITHRAEGYGRLSACIDYNFARYNYYTVMESDPFQNFNDAALRLDWKSESASRFCIDAGAGFRYTGFSTMYIPYYMLQEPSGPDDNLIRLSGQRDMDITLGADMSMTLGSRRNYAGVRLDGEIILTEGLKGSRKSDLCRPQNYGILTLEPYYRHETDRLRFIAGARMDFPINTASGTGLADIYPVFPKSRKGQDFYISPDLRFDYVRGSVAVEIHATGGASLYTLSTAHDRDFYCQPGTWNTLPEYSPLDATAAFRFGPFSGFQFRVSGSYRITKQLRNGGWYTLFLNEGRFYEGDNIFYNMTAPADLTVNLSGVSLGLGLSYEYGPEFRINAEGTWQPQHGKTGYFNGYDMPELTAAVAVESNPWSSLRLTLRYDLRALRRSLVDYSTLSDDIEIPLRNWSNLCFIAGYDIFRNFTLGVRLDNLLNRKQSILYGLPMPGLTASGTLTYVF